ncbi:MAG TPA: hypothetical protein VFX97_16935 [Pyrinomonadaceae bacterium]|nr:hypothetical protein [Pyrinomonadaceae bacterium]
MKFLLVIFLLAAVLAFTQQPSAQVACEGCPLPDATPTPQPTPFDPGDPPPFGCYYVVINGVKHIVCE